MDGVFTQSDECEGSKKDFSLWLEMTNMDRRWIFYHCDIAFKGRDRPGKRHDNSPSFALP